MHHELTQWSSENNDIVAAAKQVALLMGKLSKLLNSNNNNNSGEAKRSKKELIAVAKAIAEAGEEVTRIAKQLGAECTDKRMRAVRIKICLTNASCMSWPFISEHVAAVRARAHHGPAAEDCLHGQGHAHGNQR